MCPRCIGFRFFYRKSLTEFDKISEIWVEVWWTFKWKNYMIFKNFRRSGVRFWIFETVDDPKSRLHLATYRKPISMFLFSWNQWGIESHSSLINRWFPVARWLLKGFNLSQDIYSPNRNLHKSILCKFLHSVSPRPIWAPRYFPLTLKKDICSPFQVKWFAPICL